MLRAAVLVAAVVGSAATKSTYAESDLYSDGGYEPPAAPAPYHAAPAYEPPAYHAPEPAYEPPAYHAPEPAYEPPAYHAPEPAYEPPAAAAYQEPYEPEALEAHSRVPQCTTNEECGEGYCNIDHRCVCTDYWWTKEAHAPCSVPRKSKVIAFLLQAFLGPLGVGCFYLGWFSLGMACLLFGGLGCICIPCMLCLFMTACGCVMKLVRCFVDLICCRCCDPILQNTEGKDEEEIQKIKEETCLYCCASWMSVLGVIFWIVGLIQISNDCISDGVPCVPWH